MGYRELPDTPYLRRRRWKRCVTWRDDVVGEPIVVRAIRPTMIRAHRQPHLRQKGVETFGGTPELSLGNRRQESRFLLCGVATLWRDYLRPFFSRRFSLVISAMTSRSR